MIARVTAAFFTIILLTCCETPLANDPVNALQGHQDSVQQEKDLAEDFRTFKVRSEATLIKNSRFIADFKVRIMTGEVALKARYQKRLIGLEKQNSDLRNRLEHSTEIHTDSLPSFKKNWNNDMDRVVRLLREMNASH